MDGHSPDLKPDEALGTTWPIPWSTDPASGGPEIRLRHRPAADQTYLTIEQAPGPVAAILHLNRLTAHEPNLALKPVLGTLAQLDIGGAGSGAGFVSTLAPAPTPYPRFTADDLADLPEDDGEGCGCEFGFDRPRPWPMLSGGVWRPQGARALGAEGLELV